MNIISASYKIEVPPVTGALQLIEAAGRTCYKSEDKITATSAAKFADMLLSRGHESVIEHASMSVRFIIDRGVSHELVRHRLASFSQESTRYCNYGKTGAVTFIRPCFWRDGDPASAAWEKHMRECERAYLAALDWGWSPQKARTLLPNSLKTELVMTANLREWRHVFKLRTSPAAHPQMREVMCPLLQECRTIAPVIFDDVGSVDTGDDHV